MHPTETIHPDDALLVAAAHRRSPPDADASALAHVAGCERCRRRVEELRRADGEIAGLLAVLDHPMPPRRPFADVIAPERRRGARRGVIAATIATLVTVGVAAALPASPIHRWLRERLAPAHQTPQVPAPTSSASGVAGISVAATPSLVVVFRHAQTDGVVDLVFVDQGDVVLRSSGGHVAYQVGDGRVVVDNLRPAPRYDIRVPVAVQRFTVVVDGRVAFVKDRGHSADHYHIPLTLPTRGTP